MRFDSPAPDKQQRRTDWLLVAFGLWTIVGLFLDGWAHSERRPDSFFTPWHAILYSGGAGLAATTLAQARDAGAPPLRALLRGADRLGVIGVALLGAGAAADLGWHQVFGIEVNLAAVLSPTHLVLMTGALLALSGPYRRAVRPEAIARRPGFAAVASLGLAAGVAFFFTFYASPFGKTAVASFPSVNADVHDFSVVTAARFAAVREMWALTGILLTTVLVVVPVIALAGLARRPRNSFVVLFGFLALFAGVNSEFAHWAPPLAMLAAGVMVEAAAVRSARVEVLAGIAPAVLWSVYFAGVAVSDGLGWSAELWAGSLVLSTGVGVVLGLVAGQLRDTGADEHHQHAELRAV